MERFTGNESKGILAKTLPAIDFQSLEEIDSPEVIAELGTPLGSWKPLHKMVPLFSDASKLLFWKTVFENRDLIPREELRKVWYTSFMDGELRLGDTVGVSRLESVRQNPLLIENRWVLSKYVEAKKPGWRGLRWFADWSKRVVTLNFSPRMEDALQEDDPVRFLMLSDMEGVGVSASFLITLMLQQKHAILRALIVNNRIPKNVMLLEELCIFCAANFADNQSVPLLGFFDKISPGILRRTHDVFGRNLLWTAVFNKYTGWFHPNCQLTPFLLEKGCDPDNRNPLGLTWREITDNLTFSQMRLLMQERYYSNRWYHHHGIWTNPPLKKVQRLGALMKKQGKLQQTGEKK